MSSLFICLSLASDQIPYLSLEARQARLTLGDVIDPIKLIKKPSLLLRLLLKLSPSGNSIIEVPLNRSYIRFTFTLYSGCTLKKINYRFRTRIGIKARNYRKIIEMNRHGNNFINFRLKKNQM